MAITTINLSSLEGAKGFRLDGAAADHYSGFSVSNAGDINGDGFDDLIIGAYGADANDSFSGSSYVVFGKASGFNATLDLSSLNGSNGFRLDGGLSGGSVSNVGDINGDGFDDLIVGADRGYVIFGKASGFNATLDLSSLNGSNGFVLDGMPVDSYRGFSVSNAGDINGDGFDDVILGAGGGGPNGPYGAGSSYVVFGKASGFGASLDLSSLNGSNGFRLDGEEEFDFLGYSVSTAGDVNGDGFDDLIVGAPGAGPSGQPGSTGVSYVVLGKAAGFSAAMNVSSLNGTNGFRLQGETMGDSLGSSVSSAGDVNGDGLGDLIIGAPHSLMSDIISSYVVFGKASGFDASLDLSSLDGSNGFRMDGGVNQNYSLGESVSSAGDVNGDGFDDLIVGSSKADPNGLRDAGSTYVVFGKDSGFDASLDLSSLDSNDGFRLNGIAEFDVSGRSVSGAGDVNGDGFDDMIVGSPGDDPDGIRDAGASYVILGRSVFTGDNVIKGTAGDDILTGTSAVDTFNAGGGNDTMTGLGGPDVFNAGTGNDTLNGGPDNDILNGWSGVDTMSGGSGYDTYMVDNAGDKVIEKLNEGTDNVHSSLTYLLTENVENLTLTGYGEINGTGNSQNNSITGNSYNNQLNGNAGNDTLYGGEGNDILTGWSGTDTMFGDVGDDTYFVESMGDVVTEWLREGTDTVSSKITYSLSPNVENLVLTGTAAVNGTGNSQNNSITGNNAANQLNTGAGSDILDGSLGANKLTGGTGNDIFKFTTKGHIDTITDYNVINDTIQLENAVFTALTTTGTLAASQFKVGTQAGDANDFVIYNKTAGTLLYDTDGSGAAAATQIASLSAGLALTNADIVVI